jgi:hypothetical protein
MNAAEAAIAAQMKAPDTVAGEFGHVLVPAWQMKAQKLHQAFVVASEMTTQPQQTLRVLAKGIKSQIHASTVGPKNLVALKANVPTLAVPGGIAAEKNSQSSRRQAIVQMGLEGVSQRTHIFL